MRLPRFFLLAFLSFPLFAGERYIVEFRDGAAAAQARAGIERDRIRREYTRVLHGVAIELRDGESIETIRRLPHVARVTPDTVVEAFGGPAASSALPPATHEGGAGVIVAVIDTGIDYTHPALGGGIGPGRKILGGYDFVNDDTDPMDDNRHGTHVAGIIAARSAVMTGTAPDASLLAYKVLGANGRGQASDIIAAVERAIADGADVINLSLGGRGNPDDPLARAVENAVAQGIVCAAAGNEGIFHAIGSPAGAPSVITVGATGGGLLAAFSSRGPATRSGAIKPDLLAPGTSIVSTVPGGGVMPLSGTSMATPYVAALAALLREAHPDWTPARIKSALVATALPIEGEEPMSQGSGAVDRARAFASRLTVSPTHVSFGLDAALAGVWQTTRRVSIRNDGDVPRTLLASVSDLTGAISIVVTPQEVVLAPGESRELEVAIRVDNDQLPWPGESLAFGGWVEIGSEVETLRLPWAFLRAGRATITYDASFPWVMWRSPSGGYGSFAPLDERGIEVLLKPGSYDFAVVGEKEGDVRLFIVEERRIDGDVTFSFSASDAPHAIALDAALPAPVAASPLYWSRLRLLFPDASGSVVLPDVAGRVLHTSSFSARFGILATEALVDAEAATATIAQHRPVEGVSGDVSLRIGEADYRSQAVEVHFSGDAQKRDLLLMPRDWPRRAEELGPMPPSLRISSSASIWRGILRMSPEVHPDFASGLQIATIENEEDEAFRTMVTPMIRRDDQGFFSIRGFARPAPSLLPLYTVAGEPLSFGAGALRPGPDFFADGGFFNADTIYRGDRDEGRRAAKLETHYRLLSAAGSEITFGTVPL
ncbi:MAG TPA: S8 family serine peptidase, partial [Thermoanaerobaculia bacterium]|nr:S8 family serine peptidase [Thermoanaerobaculia bacterium]